MDVLSSILKIKQEDTSSATKNKEPCSDQQKEQRSFKCSACGEFFSREEILSHNLSHIQGSSVKKEYKVSNINKTSHSDGKPSYKCTICGKLFTQRKTFVSHKLNHKRNKKMKELGVHLFDKESCLKMKASLKDGQIYVKPSSEVMKDMASYSYSEAEMPVKMMNDPDDVTANPMSSSGDWMPLNTVSPIHAFSQSCTQAQQELPTKRPSEKVDHLKLKSSGIEKVDYAAPSFGVKFNANPSGVKTEMPVKLMIRSDVTANPMSCAGDWMPPEPSIRSYDAFSTLPSTNTSSGNFSQINRNPPVKKTSFECNKCDRTFSNRKTFVNHKTNHVQNKTKLKLLRYNRPNSTSSKTFSKKEIKE